MIYSYCGEIKKGDFVKITKDDIIRKVKDFKQYQLDKPVYVTLYHSDETGGYSIEVPHYDVVEVVSENDALELDKKKEEVLEKPKRYNKTGKLECWDVIIDQDMNFLEGSVLKYLWRYKEKNGIHDLKKAIVYINKIISELEKK